MMMILSMMIVMTMMIKQTDDHLKYDDEGKGVGDLKPLSIRIFDTLLSRVHLKLLNEIIEGTMFGGAITMIMMMMIYIYYDEVFVCIFVTKKHHFLLRVSCYHRKHK